eukprot:scaffold44250_cov234-Skeletonema_marinoi.AAC.2
MQQISLLQFFASIPVEQHHLAQQLPPLRRPPPEAHQFLQSITELPQVYSMNTFSVQQKHHIDRAHLCCIFR